MMANDIDQQSISDTYVDYLEMFDCVEQAVLKENPTINDKIDWLYFIEEDGEKKPHSDMFPPVKGVLRADPCV